MSSTHTSQLRAPFLILSEGDVRSFLREPEPRTDYRPLIKGLAGFLVLMISLSAGAFYFLNAGAFARSATAAPAATPITTASPSTAVAAGIPQATPAQPTPAALPENTVGMADLGISAPVHWDISFTEKVIQKQLQSGVVHLAGTAKPGQRGNVVIFGHSSADFWVPGDYKAVFAPLIKAQPGQEILVQYQGVTYQYRVLRTYEVVPTDLTPLSYAGEDSLTLITCTPIGLSLRRHITYAKQISPDPAANTAFTQTDFTGGTIPGN